MRKDKGREGPPRHVGTSLRGHAALRPVKWEAGVSLLIAIRKVAGSTCWEKCVTRSVASYPRLSRNPCPVQPVFRTFCSICLIWTLQAFLRAFLRAARELNASSPADRAAGRLLPQRRAFNFLRDELPPDATSQVPTPDLGALRRAGSGLRPCLCCQRTEWQQLRAREWRGLLLQARYLRELNQGGNHEAVIQLFESGRLTQPEAAMAEYVAALARTNRLDNSRLLQTLQVLRGRPGLHCT